MAQERIKRFHRQVGVFASFWLVLAALTALALNHRDLWLTTSSGDPKEKNSPYGHYLLCEAQSPHSAALVLVGTADGVFLSSDAGKSFSEVALPMPATQVVGVAFHPTNSDQLYVALREGPIFSSQDGGKKWDRVSYPGTSTIQAFSVSGEGTLNVLSPDGIYSRVQENWTLAPRPPTSAPENRSRRWLRWIYNLHDGQAWGKAAVLVTDCLSLAILALVISGLWMAYSKKP